MDLDKICTTCNDDYEHPVVTQVKCCICGILIEANSSNMCINCLRANVDISEGLTKDYTVVYCPECERYLQPPKYWSKAPFESRELMVICLKKIKGLSKYNLVDATFVWTEEHSKRLKLKIVLQKEVFAKTIIQQTVLIDYVIHWQQCDRCARAATGQPQWASVVQLRQKAEHKRTFLYLEQLILKHRMHEDAIKIENHPMGLDFFFAHKSHGNSFLQFVANYVPIRRTDAEELVSHDSKSNTAIEHHTFSIEMCPLCREDLVCLPPKLRAQLGATGPLVLVYKIFSSIVFIDPRTLKASEITGSRYWTHPFQCLANTKQLQDFYVIDIELEREVNARFQLARVTIQPANDVGGENTYQVTTHLGRVLKPGDYAKGYFLKHINHNNDEIEKYDPTTLEDVVLVRKHYPNQKRRRGKRVWKLKQLDVIQKDNEKHGKGALRNQEDMEEFADDVERDPEFREEMALYRDEFQENLREKRAQQQREGRLGAEDGKDGAGSDDEEDDEPEVDLAELLDELKLDDEDPDFEGEHPDYDPAEEEQIEVPSAGKKRLRND